MKLSSIAYSLLLSLPFIAQAAMIHPNDQLAEDQDLVRGNGAEPATLDPTFVNSGMPGDIIANDMFEGLLIEDSQGKIIAGQASKWSVSDDGKTVTFTLRDGITWSNGQPVLASDFVFAWQRAVDPKTGNNTGHYFTTANIENAGAILKGEKPSSALGIKAVDAKTLQVKLEKPTPYFFSLMSIKTFFPLPQKVVEKHGSHWTRPENMVTNGAYSLVKWVPNEYVEVVRNPHYWDNEHTVINKVTYLGLASQAAELARFQAGEIDMTNRVQLDYYQKLLKENPDQIKAQPLLGTYLYSFNTKHKPFDDVRVRQALSMAVDRDILVEKITGQGEPAAYSLVPETIPDYQLAMPDFFKLTSKQRMQKATELLKAAGFDQQHPLSFTLTYNTSENHKKIALALASMWKPLGVKVELRNMEWQGYVASKAVGDYQVARSWMFADYPEPSGLLNNFTCAHVANESGYCDPKFDALMAQAANETDKTQRYQLYHQAEDLLNQAEPFIPLHHYMHTRVVRETLKGLPENNPKGNIYAKDMYFVQP
ncbi:peptide ABC transporter substrate-binding protein [Vibrio aphrogenes]|uniref:peptide ABC transporter substrate-binding protein n=1 Tax=Vibrio aphrogenes TaxID=1891186 RepID=UPI000B36205B|nr:peptide ABC transporter substrate-binding protein [Vibrio aphrogenes]